MTSIKTNAELLRALQGAVVSTPSQHEIEEQRLSYVMGMLPQENSMTREQVQQAIDKHEGRRVAAG
jgi:hypothetical protein